MALGLLLFEIFSTTVNLIRLATEKKYPGMLYPGTNALSVRTKYAETEIITGFGKD